MGTWKEFIERMRSKWIGKEVSYKGETFTVVDVDYNGSLMINLPSQFNQTTAIDETMLDKPTERRS